MLWINIMALEVISVKFLLVDTSPSKLDALSLQCVQVI